MRSEPRSRGPRALKSSRIIRADDSQTRALARHDAPAVSAPLRVSASEKLVPAAWPGPSAGALTAVFREVSSESRCAGTTRRPIASPDRPRRWNCGLAFSAQLVLVSPHPHVLGEE